MACLGERRGSPLQRLRIGGRRLYDYLRHLQWYQSREEGSSPPRLSSASRRAEKQSVDPENNGASPISTQPSYRHAVG